MKNGIILSAVMAALCASGETVKTATQPWVRSYVATNRTDVSGKADVTNVYTKAETDAKIVELAPTPGDYETVSNRAMSALQSHQSLRPSTNYTDAALGAFAETGTVARAAIITDGTKMIDAAGNVYTNVREFIVFTNGVFAAGWTADNFAGDTTAEGTYYDLVVFPEGQSEGDGFPVAHQNVPLGERPSWSNEYEVAYSRDYEYEGLSEGDTVRVFRGEVLLGRIALTNDIPAIPAETDPTVPAWAKAQNKPTYTASEVGATDGAAVTNIVRQMSLCGIWDSKLGVWWTPHMSGGAYYWTATTNVNLNAEN